MKHFLIIAALLTSAPALAHKLGGGGTMVDGNQALEQCAGAIGTVSLSEEKKTAGLEAGLSAQLAAFLAMAYGPTAARPRPL